MNEPALEPFLRRLRLRRVTAWIARYPNCALLDVGCGWEAKLLRAIEPAIASGMGIDKKAPRIEGTGKLQTVRCDLEQTFPFEDATFDVVTMLAVLEHLNAPLATLAQIRRVLKPGGILVLTVPSHAAKPVLEFLAYRLRLVNPEEIADHKRYWNREELAGAAAETGFRLSMHEYFQFGFNNFAVFSKTGSLRCSSWFC